MNEVSFPIKVDDPPKIAGRYTKDAPAKSHHNFPDFPAAAETYLNLLNFQMKKKNDLYSSRRPFLKQVHAQLQGQDYYLFHDKSHHVNQYFPASDNSRPLSEPERDAESAFEPFFVQAALCYPLKLL